MATNDSGPAPDIGHVREAMREHDDVNPRAAPKPSQDGSLDESEDSYQSETSRVPERP